MGNDLTIAIVAATVDMATRRVTEEAVRTARNTVPSAVIMVYETSGTPQIYPQADKVIAYAGQFRYNRVLNQAIRECETPLIALCNNDLVFRHGWYGECRKVMDTGGYLSCSPAGRGCRVSLPAGHRMEGYGIGQQLCGWCLIVRRELFDQIGALDEGVEFWYSDNLYAEQLRAAGVKHVLAGGRLVDHVESVTLNKKDTKERHRLTQLQREVFNGLRKKYTQGNPGIV
jgi:hypothetical protein